MNPFRGERRSPNKRQNLVFLGLSGLLFVAGLVFLWVATLKIPDLSDLTTRRVAQSTKIYDRTGTILLYDLGQDMRRTLVPFEDISPDVKRAVVSIEDKNFYTHGGIDLGAMLRAVFVDVSSLSFSQGGSTITQQVVKNSILTNDKSITRKLKEWVLALKLDNALSKDEVLNLYLNEIPFGGNLYGVEEASMSFFNKHAKDVDLAESAYLAAIINAPTYYSPYGSHTSNLEDRKNRVLKEMLDQKSITQEEYDAAKSQVVVFSPKENTGGIKAPHFVFFVIDWLRDRYGEDALQNGGLKITTTLDYDIESKAEALAKKYGDINQAQFNANNNAIVAIDPKSGDILAMVGSRNYFDQKIGGNFNAATGHRQPGSTFKPFVYSVLFDRGYTPDTILWDVPTEFSTDCAWNDFNDTDPTNKCYSPQDYDEKFRGPMKIRDALAQSINVPAVKALYLAGIQSAIDRAKDMGITSLTNPAQYGLTLVLGGGEVSPLEMVSAYSVFANDGVRNPYNPILKVEDGNGQVLEEHTPSPMRVLEADTARNISDILSDAVARLPAYGAGSPLTITDRPVAVKTGTTNDSKDAWIIGYTPNIAVGAWVGNNENTPMVKKVAGLIVAPMWRALMDQILPNLPVETFPAPPPVDQTIKPILRGDWSTGGVHSILYWVDKTNPLGPQPSNPGRDSQYSNWENAIQSYVSTHGFNQPQAVPQQQQQVLPVTPNYYPGYPYPIYQTPGVTTQ
ncbi:penicillin-binding protein [Candidatus Parcubacteria bacterium]|nr:penicillin-binding protein [Candidatus Parcubacteria bacterium]